MLTLQARATAALVLALSSAAQAAVLADATVADKSKPAELHAAGPALSILDSKTVGANAAYGPADTRAGDIEGAATPEPASIGLLLAGIGMIAVMSSRRRPR